MTSSALRRPKLHFYWIGLPPVFATRPFRPIRSGVALLLFGLAIFCGTVVPVEAQVPVTVVSLDNSKTEIDLWSHLTILSDPTHYFSISDVLAKQDKFQVPRTPRENLGPRKDTVWFRADIVVPEKAPVDWWLTIDFIHLDEVDLYVVENGRVTQHMSARQQQPFARLSYPIQRPVFQLALQRGRQYELMIRVRKVANFAMLMPVSLVRTSFLDRMKSTTLFGRSLAIGIGASFIMYALFTAALKRDPLYLWFALFSTSVTAYAFSYYGLANEYLWPNSVALSANVIARYCMLMRAFSLLLFLDGVLDLHEQSPRASWLLRSLAVFFAILTGLFFVNFVGPNLLIIALITAGVWSPMLLVPLSVYRARYRDPQWGWTIAGVACQTTGMIISTALQTGFLPWSRWAESATHLGALFSMSAWAVVTSIRTHRRQRAAELAADRERRVVARLAVDLGHQKEIAEEASLTKSRFLAAASHDLRQPAHALSLFIGALRGVPMNAKGRDLVDQIEASADAMDRLFAVLLDISKLDAGIVEVRRQPFSIDTVLNRVCNDYAREATTRSLKLSYVRCRAIVDSDPTLVERIARNLISNAVRYTDAGRIVVGCRRRGSSVVMQVWDTGRGIPPGQQEQVFQEYYQVGNPERDREKGLGLGLAIVRRVADLLECDLYLRSEVGRGSCFEISLPRASEAAMPLSGPLDEICVTSTAGLVVVVDDEKAIRTGMSALLTDWGYEVLATASADEAIQLLAGYAAKPALLICDLRLRDGENGIEAIEKLRTEYNESIPAMLITGDTAASRLFEAQASELPVLHKPVPNSRLRATITHLIAGRSKRQESDTEV